MNMSLARDEKFLVLYRGKKRGKVKVVPWIASLRPCPKVPRNVPVTSFMGAESVGAVVPAAERTTCVCSTSWWERWEKLHAIDDTWLVQQEGH